jgi:hypothetical protein
MKVNKEHVTSNDLRKHKKILLLTNAHFEIYQPGELINVSRGKEFREIIAQFSRGLNAGGSNQSYAVHGKNTKMSARALYYNPEKPSAFSKLNKQSATLPKKNKSDFKAWLENQDTYTMYRPVRKRFLRNPYTVSNFMDLWECVLLEMQSLAKYYYKYSYILSVIDVLSKYLHQQPAKTMRGRQSLRVSIYI